jgi:hypothetical protein
MRERDRKPCFRKRVWQERKDKERKEKNKGKGKNKKR